MRARTLGQRRPMPSMAVLVNERDEIGELNAEPIVRALR
jgi:hypothetical protein